MNAKPKRARPWPDRLRKLLGPNPHGAILGLTVLLQVTQDDFLDWLMGKRAPPAKAARKIEKLERRGRGPAPAPAGGRTWFRMGEPPRRPPAPPLPKIGPLGYERYLDLLDACARACVGPEGYSDDDRHPHRWPTFRPSPSHREDGGSPDRKQALLHARRRLARAAARFADEIRDFPITKVAVREGWSPEEVLMAAHLLKSDIPAFEGSGSVPGQALVQIARDPGGDRLAARRALSAEGRLRKSGLVERQAASYGFFGPGGPDRPSVLDASYALTARGRKELLGPLLARCVEEAGTDGVGRATDPRFRLGAVVLSAAHQKQVGDFLAELRHRALLYERWGLARVVHYGKGMTLLFEGPPGTGKTLLAEGLAGEAGMKFITARFPQIVSKWVGDTEKNIQRLFQEAGQAGAVLFIDEADGLFGSRENAQRSWEIRDVNVLLKEVEEFEGVCILATNHAVALDRALESRLALRLAFGMPDEEARLLIWKKHLPPELPLGADVDLPALARRHAISGRDIKEAVRAAARAAAARDGEAGRVGMADLDAAAGERGSQREAIGFKT